VQDEKDSLDSFLAPAEQHGTFHDAMLRRLAINHEEATCTAEFELHVGDPDAINKVERERTRVGNLSFTGLLFWVSEPPRNVPMEPGGSAWLTSHGPLAEAPSQVGKGLSLGVPPEAKAWYFYFSDTNAFAYVAATSVAFDWA
jgi:hypothetical protein